MTDDEEEDLPADAPVDDGEIEVGKPLTPEERESLRRTVSSIRQFLASPGTLPKVTFPEPYFRKVAALTRIVEGQQEMVSRAVQPFLDMQKQISASINSDAIQNIAQTQLKFADVAAQLTKNIDFGFLDDAAKIVGNFIDQHSAWLENLGPALAAMRASFYPSNLRAIDGLTFDLVETVIMSEGIPLYGVPRASIAESLVRAASPSKRREILGARWRAISADCRAVVDDCSSGAVGRYVVYARAALDALDDGHSEAAQALAASLVDTVVRGYFGNDRTKYTPHPKGKRTTDAYYELAVRDLTAFAPIWQAYQQFEVANGDKVPTTFSRHATAHAVSTRQYSRHNAVQSVMLACSLLYRIDEKATALERAA